MNEVFIGIGIIAFSTILGAFGAMQFKLGSGKVKGIWSFVNKHVIFGVLLYGISSLFFIYALRFGDLSVLYPIAGLTYVWIAILSVRLLGEKMNSTKIAGMVCIIIGVVFAGLGG